MLDDADHVYEFEIFERVSETPTDFQIFYSVHDLQHAHNASPRACHLANVNHVQECEGIIYIFCVLVVVSWHVRTIAVFHIVLPCPSLRKMP